MYPIERSDLGDTLHTEHELRDELDILHRYRRRDRLLHFLALLCINLTLIAALSFYDYRKNSNIYRMGESPSDSAYRIEQNLMRLEERVIQKPNPNRNIEDALWHKSISFDAGFIWIDDPEQYDLPPGLPRGPSGEGKLYGLSWGHQMHCLMMIRDEYLALLHNDSDFVYGPERLNATEKARFNHIHHCFHYIRENVLCSRDMTLEWAAGYPDELGNEHHIDGYGIPHRCRNDNYASQFVKDHQPGIAMTDEHGLHVRTIRGKSVFSRSKGKESRSP